MKLVIIESPYAGDVERNTDYAFMCFKDSLSRNESPIASHMLYAVTGMLDDAIPVERKQGMEAGHAWLNVVDKVVVYQDYGISKGMREGIKRAEEKGVRIIYRTLGLKNV